MTFDPACTNQNLIKRMLHAQLVINENRKIIRRLSILLIYMYLSIVQKRVNVLLELIFVQVKFTTYTYGCIKLSLRPDKACFKTETADPF